MNGIDVYRLMFDDLCEECGVRPHKHNYLHFLEAVVMLKHKSSDIYISDLKSLFMGHHRLLISLLLTVMR